MNDKQVQIVITKSFYYRVKGLNNNEVYDIINREEVRDAVAIETENNDSPIEITTTNIEAVEYIYEEE